MGFSSPSSASSPPAARPLASGDGVSSTGLGGAATAAAAASDAPPSRGGDDGSPPALPLVRSSSLSLPTIRLSAVAGGGGAAVAATTTSARAALRSLTRSVPTKPFRSIDTSPSRILAIDMTAARPASSSSSSSFEERLTALLGDRQNSIPPNERVKVVVVPLFSWDDGIICFRLSLAFCCCGSDRSVWQR